MAQPIHIWNRCHACGAAPIVGLRFTCQTCPSGMESDLCQACYSLFEQGRVQHPPPEAREAPAGRHVFRAFAGSAHELFVHWLSVPMPTVPAPTVPDRCLVRPEFRSGGESFFGSYGFIVAAEGDRTPLMLTALHVLDELAKFRGIDGAPENTAYTGRELPQQVSSARLYDPFAPRWILAELGSVGPMLCLPDARICSEEPDSHRDIAAFSVPASAPYQAARLAAAPPIVGDPIWLAANLGRGADSRTIQGVIVEITEHTLVFRFVAQPAMPPYTSGAPLLNRAGEVVGINIGAGILDGHRLGHGNHVASVRRHLATAAGR